MVQLVCWRNSVVVWRLPPVILWQRLYEPYCRGHDKANLVYVCFPGDGHVLSFPRERPMHRDRYGIILDDWAAESHLMSEDRHITPTFSTGYVANLFGSGSPKKTAQVSSDSPTAITILAVGIPSQLPGVMGCWRPAPWPALSTAFIRGSAMVNVGTAELKNMLGRKPASRLAACNDIKILCPHNKGARVTDLLKIFAFDLCRIYEFGGPR
ncbi:hypothetical protein KCU61_g323, partial [Aureobasidium melanogenum]